jgi:hypothetical protein
VLRAPEAIAMRFITCGHVCGCQFGTRHGVFQRLPPRCSRTAAKLTSTISRTLDTSWCGEQGCTSMSINVQPFALFKYSRYPAVQLLTSDKRIIKSKKNQAKSTGIRLLPLLIKQVFLPEIFSTTLVQIDRNSASAA